MRRREMEGRKEGGREGKGVPISKSEASTPKDT